MASPKDSTVEFKHECDSCDGYYFGTWMDARRLGWQRHEEKGATFQMCDDCEDRFAQRRLERARRLGEAA